jgi:xanthine dehydrogenase accessory factor
MHSLSHLLRTVGSAPETPWVLATLVRATGSSYRRLGARLVVDQEHGCVGTLSGGCLEGDIARRARTLLAESGSPVLMPFDTRLLYGCEGQVEILLERLPPKGHILEAVAAAFRARQACRIAVTYAGDDPHGSRLVSADTVCGPGVFSELLVPPVRLLLFGTGPEIGMLRALSACLGWECAAFAQPDELPPDFTPDAWTGAVVLNHHFGRDCATLQRLLPCALPYVGLLGPRRRRSELLAAVAERQELPAGWRDRLHAPAGLDLGGESPDEIAFAIVSEALAVFNGRTGGFLRERQLPIHNRPTAVASPA